MTKEGINPNPNLERILKTSFLDFLSRNSAEYGRGGVFGGQHHYPTTTEHNYPESLSKISVHGGIHLAVAGGLDPALGQIGRAKPDLTVLCDINGFAIPVIYRRLFTLGEADNGQDYWRLAMESFRADVRLGIMTPLLFTDSEVNGGWSSPQYYPVVREAWQRGAVKLINADITDHGLNIGLDQARETSIPIKLIYLSNIFDYQLNQMKVHQFVRSLRRGLEEKLIDPKAEVVEASLETPLANEVFLIDDYLERLRIDFSD